MNSINPDKLLLVRSNSADPYRNLALEQYLLRHTAVGEYVLYLWQNDRTVVIGKNQNSYAECRVEKLISDGGHLARRCSGGGAVYHDMGNLNFSFIASDGFFDIDRHYAVILKAVSALGAEAERTGRNDVTAAGRKFSGNAFSQHKSNRCHHGTLMVNTDREKIAEYLSVSSDKLLSKGVKSVSSRVVNLSEILPGITVGALSDTIINAFMSEFGASAEALSLTEINNDELNSLTELFSSEEWLYSERVPCEARLSHRFEWGSVELCFSVVRNRISGLRVFSDALDADLIEDTQALLENSPFTREGITQALAGVRGERDIVEDIGGLLFEKL